MAITPDRLTEIARRSPLLAQVALLKRPGGDTSDTAGDACWCQEIAPPNATPAQRTAARTRLTAAAAAAGTARGWVAPVTVEEERTERGIALHTIYVFRAG